ncbi:MAG: lytic transglycosylase domain-containing protein [Clostridia bacterium]|nr:lytic transglycosylase domain-containing protein [Clostridia bacterium]
MKKIYKPKDKNLKEKLAKYKEHAQVLSILVISTVLVAIAVQLLKPVDFGENKEIKAEPISRKIQETTTEIGIDEIPTQFENVPLEKSQIIYILEKSYERGIDPALVFALIEVESNFDNNAENGSCYGLMQVNANNYEYPEIARNSLGLFKINIDAGIDILDYYLEKYPLEKALTCYNFGEVGAKGKDTSGYAQKVLKVKEKYE